MNMAKLQQDILRCKEVVSEIMIKHYDADTYREIVNSIFESIFKDYFDCPNKIEPQSGHLPEESLKKIRNKFGNNNN